MEIHREIQQSSIPDILKTPVSRRNVLKLGGMGALAVGADLLLSGCDIKTYKDEGIIPPALGLEPSSTSIRGWRVRRFEKGAAQYNEIPVRTEFLSNGGQIIFEKDKTTDIYIGRYKAVDTPDSVLAINKGNYYDFMDFMSPISKSIDAEVIVFENVGYDRVSQKYLKISRDQDTDTLRVDELLRKD